MILVRNRNGTLYFLAREGGEALDALRRAYPERSLAVVEEGDGLAILRVGDVAPDGNGGERLAIVNVTLPPVPPAFSFRARGSVPSLP
jgi:hypothetical protein